MPKPTLQQAVALQAFTTMGVPAQAAYYLALTQREQLTDWATRGLLDREPRLVLGGGSNVLFINDFDGLVLHNQLAGLAVVQETEEAIYLKVGGGVVWHELVSWTVDRGWLGLENLALIPGTVGAAPIQNIGAYGVEQDEVFHEAEAFDLLTHRFVRFTREECGFGYRTSRFKHQDKGRYLITSVTYRLRKQAELRTDYASLASHLAEQGLRPPFTQRQVFEAVIAVRQSKLPDPTVLGNCGSFFQNPVVPVALASGLARHHPNLPQYPTAEGQVKLAAGWLIEQAGWRGKTLPPHHRVGTYPHQALVLVNHGGGTGEEVWQLAQAIQQAVQEQFGVRLVPEVNVLE